jgi:hypothetical protein
LPRRDLPKAQCSSLHHRVALQAQAQFGYRPRFSCEQAEKATEIHACSGNPT